jgi:hypothetical protein
MAPQSGETSFVAGSMPLVGGGYLPMQKRVNRGGALRIKPLPIRRCGCVIMRVLELRSSYGMRLGFAPKCPRAYNKPSTSPA